MTLELTPALEQRLEHLAAETDRAPHDLASIAVEAYLNEHEELAAVKESDEEFARGEFVPHEEVSAYFKQHFARA